MDYNNISGCITTIKDDTVIIDDSKFPILPLPLEGDKFCDMELGTLICSSDN